MTLRQTTWGLTSAGLLLIGAARAGAQAPAPGPAAGDPNIRKTSLTATADRPAAVVNGEAIPAGEVKRLLDARPYPVTLPEEQKKALRQAALDMLVDDLLMRQYLRKHVPQLDPAEITKEMQSIQESLKKQNKTIEQVLRESGQSEAQLRADVQSRMQWRNYLQRQMPEAQLKKYYDDNKLFFDKVFVRASHILIKVPASAPADQKALAAQKVKALRNEIAAGRMKFDAAAKQYSDCPSKDKGGDIGPFPYKFVVVEPFARAAFALKKGEMSDVVATDFGVHLILVTDRTAGEPSTFEGVREAVREVWAQDIDLYQRILAEQRKNSKIEVSAQ